MTKLKDWSQNLNKKKYLYNEAERLYIYNFLTIDELASRLNLNRKTIMDWKDKGDWEKQKKDFLSSKQSFHYEMYEFVRKLMSGIIADMEAGEKVDPGRMYAFCRIIPMFTKVKDYEDATAQKEVPIKPKGLTAELIRQIEQEVLGIVPNDDNEEE